MRLRHGRATCDSRNSLGAQRQYGFELAVLEVAPHLMFGHLQAQQVVVQPLGKAVQFGDLEVGRSGVATALSHIRADTVDADLTLQVGAVIQRQRTLGMGQCDGVGLSARRIFSRQQPVMHRLTGAACALEVFGDVAGRFGLAPAAAGLQPQRGLAVALPLVGFEHGAVGHLVQQVVAKRVFLRALKAAARLRQGQLALAQGRQVRHRARVDRGQRRVPELRAHHTGLLQALAFTRLQGVQRGLQHRHQRGRHLQSLQSAVLHLPVVRWDRSVRSARLGLDDASVHQHLHQRFHVVRVACGLRRQQGLQLRRRPGQALQQGAGQCLAGGLRQRFQHQALVDRPTAAPVEPAQQQFRPGTAQHYQGQICADRHQVIDGVQRFIVGPLQVVQHQHQRLLCSLQAQVLGPGVQAARAQLFAVAQDAGDGGAGAVVQANELPEHRRLLFSRRAKDRRQGR